ncbi:MAG: hypothetical protein AB4062_06850 [Crocosphaera sp.]
MKKKWFQFVIILLISISVILAFSESVKPQTINPSELEKWQLSIDLDVDKCSSDQQIKIGNEPLFCLKDVAELPHPDSPDYWQQHADKVRAKAQSFSKKLTDFANTSIPVEELQISGKLSPISRECKEKDEQNICEPLRYFFSKEIFYYGKNQYFNKNYKHQLMAIGITPKVGYYIDDLATKILEDTLEKKCMGKKDKQKQKCINNTLTKTTELETEIKKEKECQDQKKCQEKIENALKFAQKINDLKELNKLKNSQPEEFNKFKKSNEFYIKFNNQLTENLKMQAVKTKLEKLCNNENQDKERQCKNDQGTQVKSIIENILKDETLIEQELEKKCQEKDLKKQQQCKKNNEKEIEKQYQEYENIFYYKNLEKYIRFKIEQYRNNYGLKSSKKPLKDPEKSQGEQQSLNAEKLSGLSSQAVKVGDQTIFYIRTWHKGISPQERAKKTNEKIEKILNNEIDIQGLGIFGEFSGENNSTNNNGSSSKEEESSKVIKIISDYPFFTEEDKAIIQINKNDAILEGVDSTEILAKRRLEKIMTSISEYREKLLKQGYNYSNGLVGYFVKLNDKRIFYIKPDTDKGLFNSSFRATEISKRINRIADKPFFNQNALMVAYLIVDAGREEQTVCILPESWQFPVGKSREPSSEKQCTIKNLEENNKNLAIIYSPKIYSHVKKNKLIKIIQISDINIDKKNKLINFSWLLDKRKEKRQVSNKKIQ